MNLPCSTRYPPIHFIYTVPLVPNTSRRFRRLASEPPETSPVNSRHRTAQRGEFRGFEAVISHEEQRCIAMHMFAMIVHAF